MTKDKQIEIMKKALWLVKQIHEEGATNGRIYFDVAKKALEKAFPKKTMTMKNAIENGMNFKVDIDGYQFKVKNGVRVDSDLDPFEWCCFLLENQDKEVEITND